jgi:hypothetical protein
MRGGDIRGAPLFVHLLAAVRRMRRASKREIVIVKTIDNMSQMTSVGPIGGEPV